MNQITPGRWPRIEAILDEAMDLTGEARGEYLARACADDPGLQADIEALVAADQRAGDFLQWSAKQRAISFLIADDGEDEGASPGDRIGPYRVVRILGHGGMGTVYLAERADGHFQQRAALKLIRPAMLSPQIVRRFLQERQILARLQHPSIAHLLDGGVTPLGQPYFALEYVDGVPITTYCDQHRLGVAERLKLFSDVCDAVQYAHDNHVVHRDLKPANILITPAGELKLLDFGIAKPMQEEARAAGDTPTLTAGAFPAMTPEYAAPEQLRGDPITTVTDVYALGVILYELLSGHRPYRFGRRTAAEVERVVCGDDPPRLSSMAGRSGIIQHSDGSTEPITPESVSAARNTRPELLRWRLTRELDSIVLCALAKDPAQRYASAAALKEDMTRYLAGRPVRAHQGTRLYRARKFTRRHRTALALGALVLLGFAAPLSFIAARGYGGRSGLSAVGLEVAAGRQPAVAQRLFEEGLRAYHQSDFSGARRFFRAAVEEDSAFALAVYYTLDTEFVLGLPPDTALSSQLRDLTHHLPERERLLLSGRIAHSMDDPALLAIADTLVARYPQALEGRLLRGQALIKIGEPDEALPHLEHVVLMDSLGLRGISAHCLACDALHATVTAFQTLDSLVAAERTVREWLQAQPRSGWAWTTLASVMEWQGRSDEAVAAYRNAAVFAPANPYTPIYPALLDIRAGDFAAADRLLREQARGGSAAVQLEALWFLTISLRYQGRLRDAFAAARSFRELQPDATQAIILEAQVLLEMDRGEEAAALFAALAVLPAREKFELTPSAEGKMRSWHLTHVADARAAAGDTARLQTLADSIEAFGAQTIRGLHRRLHHHVRGLLLNARGQTDEAAEQFYLGTFWPTAPTSGFTRTNLELGRTLLALGRPEEAVRLLQPAFRGPLESTRFYVTHTELHEALGRAWEAAGRPDSAAAHYRWVVNAWQNADPHFHTRRESVRARLRALR